MEILMKKRREVLLKNWSSSSTTWEERAFAEDAFGDGQMIWPPRSYSCSYCKREFRSAQALGGHMNVHRRDRAACRLIKWSPPPPPHSTLISTLSTNSSSRVSISSSSSSTNIIQQKCKSTSPFSCFDNPTQAASSVGNTILNSNLALQYDLEAAMDMVSCCNKRAKTSTASFSTEEIDLELRLGDPRPYNKVK